MVIILAEMILNDRYLQTAECVSPTVLAINLEWPNSHKHWVNPSKNLPVRGSNLAVVNYLLPICRTKHAF